MLLGDTLIDSVIPATQQLIDIYEQYRQTIISVERVPNDQVHRYGIIESKNVSDRITEVTCLVEKPSASESPSNLAIAGRYILTPGIYSALEQTKRGRNNEIQLTDALKILLGSENIFSYVIEGVRYDIGNKLDYLKTIVKYGLKREEFRDTFLTFLQQTIKNSKRKK